MYKYFRQSQCISSLSKAILLCSSAFLVLAAPTITELSASKVLAEKVNVVSQNLEAASFFQQGVMRYNRKNLQGAESAFRQALQLDPNIALAHNYLGNIMLEQNRLEAAVQEYAEAIRLNPNVGDTHYNLGLALHKQGQSEAAITAYRQALVINPTMASAQYNLGLALYQKGRAGDAIAAYQQAVNLDSTNADAYFNLAIVLQEQGQMEEAIAAYRQAIKLNPKNALAYNNMGSLLVLQGQTSDAVATYQEAIRSLPKNAEAYYNLGVTWYNQGEFKKANGAFKRARHQYREQGNTEQVNKVEQLIQKIAQMQGQKQPQVSQTSPAQAPAHSSNVPVLFNPQQTPSQPETSTQEKVDPEDAPFSLAPLLFPVRGTGD
ncbi:tetratricopeptide repeat protein [Chlorogloeopsis sp. ULAP01]|uniref:tetratricopeptide repeat protein n=1 Tax=Chlorogloeopsis sp. ULAP01 TaxID=3056483 RepID=UPI0025AA9C25|nr:tetratricopeptide repeat protein [Chlorogloeopsis sp. ULAP01]MDM9385062.1 tetratricopeptide repeat protein [Chlorogloeopsis sp. ULAP01]